MSKKHFAKKVWVKKMSGQKKFWFQRNFGTKNSCPKNLDKKYFWLQKISKTYLGQKSKIIESKEIWSQKIKVGPQR